MQTPVTVMTALPQTATVAWMLRREVPVPVHLVDVSGKSEVCNLSNRIRYPQAVAGGRAEFLECEASSAAPDLLIFEATKESREERFRQLLELSPRWAAAFSKFVEVKMTQKVWHRISWPMRFVLMIFDSNCVTSDRYLELFGSTWTHHTIQMPDQPLAHLPTAAAPMTCLLGKSSNDVAAAAVQKAALEMFEECGRAAGDQRDLLKHILEPSKFKLFWAGPALKTCRPREKKDNTDEQNEGGPTKKQKLSNQAKELGLLPPDYCENAKIKERVAHMREKAEVIGHTLLRARTSVARPCQKVGGRKPLQVQFKSGKVRWAWLP